MLRVLIAHVQYRQRGGEEAVVEREADLLRRAGHEVQLLVLPSAGFDNLSLKSRAAIAWNTGDHAYGRKMVRGAVVHSQPDVVHFHNLYPLFGPGAMDEAHRAGCAVVQTLHNYRLTCLAGTHFRDDAPCELCTSRVWGEGLRRGCYRGSRVQSALLSRGLAQQWAFFEQGVPDVLICLTEFARQRLLSSGVPGDALLVKPNSVEDGVAQPDSTRAGVCFVGRLSPEKGILPLLRAWGPENPVLRVIGEGPLRERVIEECGRRENCEYVGLLEPSGVRTEVGSSLAVAIPSLWYEGLPLVFLEALAEGTPVVAFNHGALSCVSDQGCGVTVELGDYPSFVSRAADFASMGNEEWSRYSELCRVVHAAYYSDRVNIEALEAVYAAALERRQAGAAPQSERP